MLGDLKTLLGDGRPFKAFSLIHLPALAGLECLFPGAFKVKRASRLL